MAKKDSNTNNQEGFSKMSINWYPGHMAKTKKQIIEDLKLIDIIVEVLDARIPRASQNPDILEYAKNKKRIVILNKADLADEKVTKDWKEYYNKKNIRVVETEANTGTNVNKIISAINAESEELEKKYIEKGRKGHTIKVMILGIPNVGKSTIINSLAKKNIAKVENKPGVTKKKQWIKIGTNIELMDTPGMLWPKFDNEEIALHLAFTNSIGQSAIDNEEIAYELLKHLLSSYKENVENRYGINIENKVFAPDEIIEIRDEIAKKKGCILSGGRINEQKISDMILIDFQTGKLGKISLEMPEK